MNSMPIKKQVQLCKERLCQIYKVLPECNIKFMYFLYRDFDPDTKITTEDPYIGECFRKMSDGTYIIKGRTEGYYYMYTPTSLRYFIYNYKPNTPQSGNRVRKPIFKHPQGDIFHGDHLDFGLFGNAYKTGVGIKLHRTVYEERLDDAGFTRSVIECDINFDANIFEKMGLEYLKVSPCFRQPAVLLHQALPENDITHVHTLCTWMSLQGGGSTSKQMNNEQWRTHTLHRGQRGGYYIHYGKTRKYIRGGTPSRYSSVSFMTQAFVRFVKKYIVGRVVYAQEERFHSVRIIYDEMGELGSNHSLTLVYDFDEGDSDIYFVDMSMLLQAVYADEVLSRPVDDELNKPTKSELTALDFFKNPSIIVA